MRPALQRLLARPASLDLLRYLVTPQELQNHKPGSTNSRCSGRRTSCRRHLSLAVAISGNNRVESVENDSSHKDIENPPDTAPLQNIHGCGLMKRSHNVDIHYSNVDYGPWKEGHFKDKMIHFEYDIEYESNLVHYDPTRPKLLEREYIRDLRLWACLFNYRKRLYGIEGVRMFWKAVHTGHFQFPVTGKFADKFWVEFVDLGLQDKNVLMEILIYANKMLDTEERRWSRLYVKIVQYLLGNGRGKEAIEWHDRLSQRHPPLAKDFSEMVRQIIYRKGDVEALKEIYERSEHRNVYSKVVPLLCDQEDFIAALEWHSFLLSKKDLPASSKDVEALVHFLAIYDRRKARLVTKSLVAAGVSFASNVETTLADNTKISREMMNLIHGETFHVPVKAYNDDLGARWFATRWVSLDVAINAISALGLQEIGPLSLQAIALRESNAESVMRRINQLRDLEISIGKSVFSRAVEKFARTGNQEFLDGLLKSEQHPDALENRRLQNDLLTEYGRSKDWFHYRLTLEIQLIGSKHPEIDTPSIILRSLINRGDTSDMLASLHRMQTKGTIVTMASISRILQVVLRRRQRGKRPVTLGFKTTDDLNMAISILKGIMESGSFVSTTFWREIIKRLGMVGRFGDLENLCIYLASWYGPANQHTYIDPKIRERAHRYRVPAQVRTSHPLHPLRILFPDLVQKAIVEWGFMHALRNPPQAFGSTSLVNQPPPVTGGIALLKRLNRYGVYIHLPAVRKAVFNRLVTYYGPGNSNRLHNRREKENNVLLLEEMAKQIDGALGVKMFDSPLLGRVVEERGRLRLKRRGTRRANHGIGGPKTGVLALSG